MHTGQHRIDEAPSVMQQAVVTVGRLAAEDLDRSGSGLVFPSVVSAICRKGGQKRRDEP